MRAVFFAVFFVSMAIATAIQAAPAPNKNNSDAKVVVSDVARELKTDGLKNRFLKTYSSKEAKQWQELKHDVLRSGGKSVPVLLEVMKNDAYPDKSRWLATFLMGQIMGKKASSLLVKFTQHPNWVLRMASLKTLLALKDKSHADAFARALRDDSFLVRRQALDNISHMELKDYAAHVWAMLYDKRNYYEGKPGEKEGTNLVKRAVRVVGDLKFDKALKPLFAMLQKDKYKDIHADIRYALEKITGKITPKASADIQQRFWKQTALSYQTI
tara:strand:+ start:893 stop:1705 length:813 start_codon:yes stop_codon:yes gene_type:complete